MASSAPRLASKKKILFVDDDPELRRIVGGYLEEVGADVYYAADGKLAQNFVGVQDELDLVISDVVMPVCNGIELLHFVKKVKPHLPVILTANLGEISGAKEAMDLGAKGFIPKPFTRDQLQSSVLGCFLGESISATTDGDPSQKKHSDENFCKLSIEDFTIGKQLQFDIFIRLSQGKYLKLAHAGEDVPIERIRGLKDKKVSFLYLRKDDFVRYLGFNIEIAKKIKDASNISHEKKANFLKHTNEIILEQFFLNELNDNVFDIAKSVVETTVGVFLELPDLGALLEALNDHSDQLYAHCLGVSFYASLIARSMDWDNPRTLYKISMGGLLHDIGKKEFDKELLVKSRRSMTAQEVKLYQSHTTRGMEILSSLRSVPSDVLQIVLHHHENCIGTGWPSGIKKNYIHPLARVVSVADEFCHMILKSPEGDPMPVPEALEKLCAVRRQEFDAAALDALLKMFKSEAAKRAKMKLT